MPKFNYVAMDTKGKEITGVLESDNTTTAVSRIREMGYFPTNITEVGKDKKPGKKTPAAPGAVSAPKPAAKKGGAKLEIKFLQGSKVKSKTLTAFTRQLATLIDAGLPLLRGLDVLRKQEKNPVLKRTLTKLAESVEAGSTFSEALAQHPKVFNRLFVNMVRAGEAGGVLDVTLSRLADFQEKAQKIKNKVVSAMVYPAVVIFVAMSILIFLMVVIVPKFQEIFRDLLEGEGLPALTQFVIGVSSLVKNQFLLVIGVLVALFFAVKMVGKTVKGRMVSWSVLKLAGPPRSSETRTRSSLPTCTYSPGSTLVVLTRPLRGARTSVSARSRLARVRAASAAATPASAVAIWARVRLTCTAAAVALSWATVRWAAVRLAAVPLPGARAVTTSLSANACVASATRSCQRACASRPRASLAAARL